MKQRGIASDVQKSLPRTRARRQEGYHPRDDRKSAEVIEDRGDSWLPWRKRVRNLMIMLGLHGCDRKKRT